MNYRSVGENRSDIVGRDGKIVKFSALTYVTARKVATLVDTHSVWFRLLDSLFRLVR